MGSLLTTLASNGDNWVKMLIIGGLIINGFLTKHDGAATRQDVDKARETAAKQIRTIYRNQNKWLAHAKLTEAQQEVIMEKLGVPKELRPKLPPVKFKDQEEDYGE